MRFGVDKGDCVEIIGERERGEVVWGTKRKRETVEKEMRLYGWSWRTLEISEVW